MNVSKRDSVNGFLREPEFGTTRSQIAEVCQATAFIAAPLPRPSPHCFPSSSVVPHLQSQGCAQPCSGTGECHHWNRSVGRWAGCDDVREGPAPNERTNDAYLRVVT